MRKPGKVVTFCAKKFVGFGGGEVNFLCTTAVRAFWCFDGNVSTWCFGGSVVAAFGVGPDRVHL